jgi:hypothetical protein
MLLDAWQTPTTITGGAVHWLSRSDVPLLVTCACVDCGSLLLLLLLLLKTAQSFK